MKLVRFKAPALAAVAVLLISGAASAFAADKAATVPAVSAVQADTAGRDADTLQEGDQTTPDVAGAADSAEAETATDTTEAKGTEADGPGGWADPAGDVNHQFDGEE